jgi:serine/threonine protein kinase
VLPESDVLIERTGMMIGRYKLLQQIGEGGFGVVFMAEQTEPVQRKAALKIIKAGMDTREIIARFEAERQALALMDHPNIARVLDAGATASGRPYFVMELVRGLPLTDYCDQAKLTTRERLELFIQVCRAVQHAHQKGVIHRDLKPSNVLVTLHDGAPVPKVIDFGVAKALGQKLTDKTLFTRFEQMIGTPAYMSPEQAALSGLDIDTRSDVYSLGVLLYELLTGVTPLDEETLRQGALDEVRRMIRETDPPKPSTRLLSLGDRLAEIAKHRHVEPAALSRLVRGDLDWITMKALEKDRQRRYETVNGLAMDIERYLCNEPVVARPPSALYRLQKTARRHRVAFAASAVVAGILVLGVIVSTWQAVRATRAEREQSRLRQQAETAQANEARERKQAQTEATRSLHVANFLEGMLKGVRPSVALGRDTRLLRDILDQTVERMSQELKDEPEVQAKLRFTIGEVYSELGEFAKAEEMTRSVLETWQKLAPDQQGTIAFSLNNLGLMLAEQGKFDEAEKLQRQALAIYEKLHPEPNAEVVVSLSNLGLTKIRRGQMGEAETLLRQAVTIGRKLEKDERMNLVGAMDLFAILLSRTGRLTEATDLYREALSKLRERYGEEHPDIAYTLNNLAPVLARQGKVEEAEAMWRQALSMRRKFLPPTHPSMAASLHNLAGLLDAQHRWPDAEPYQRELLENYRARLPADSKEVLSSAAGLGSVLAAWAWTERGGPEAAAAEARARESVQLLRDCLTRRLASTPGASNTLADAKSRLAGALIALAATGSASSTGNRVALLAEAEPLLSEAYETLRQNANASSRDERVEIERFTQLYETWDSLVPNSGKSSLLEHWKKKLAALPPPDTSGVPKGSIPK